MPILASALVFILGLLHVYILVLEMFLWDTDRGRKAFKLTAAFSAQTKVMAANQGLYNGFLAAGLFWGLLHPSSEFAGQIQLCFAAFVLVAGLYGGATVGKKILFVQAVPATLTILLLLAGI